MPDVLNSLGGKKKRKDWVDALRALAMFFVILGHQIAGKTAYFVFTSPIKIPLFFMITGYVFNYNRKSTAEFFKNLFFKLVIPWLCLTVPFVFLMSPAKWATGVPKGLFDILSGAVGWYMPCCIVAEIIWFFICKLLKKPRFIVLAACGIAVAGYILGYFKILEFARINTAMIAQFYILLGYLFKLFEQKISRLNWWHLLALTVLYVGIGVVSLIVWPSSYIDVHNNYYYNYPVCITMIVLGCVTIFAAARKLGEGEGFRIPRLVSFLGQNTIIYYLLHSKNIAILVFILSSLSLDPPEPVLVCLKVVFAYVLCGLEAMIILRVCPRIMGRKRVPSKKNRK